MNRAVPAALAAAVLLAGCAGTTSSSTTPSAPATSTTATTPTPPVVAPVSLITEPDQGVAPVLTDVTQAKKSIDLVMYELEDTNFEAALASAAKRGVAVRVLLNGGYYGKPDNPNPNGPAYTYLKAHGVPVRWTPAAFALTHQKTMIVDGSTAVIMTFNLTSQYYASSRDFGIVDSQPADVTAIESTFSADWAGTSTKAGDGKDLVWSPGAQPAEISAITAAKGELDVYNEEMDDTPVEEALEAAAKRGVDVRVVMTASSDWDTAFKALTAAGVHVRTYAANASLYIHAKMILSSGRALVGSQNFSPTSLDDNRELGIKLSSATVVAALKSTFAKDYASATPFS